MSLPRIAIYGASGQARAMTGILTRGIDGQSQCIVEAYIDDFAGGRGTEFNGCPLLDFEQWRDMPERLPVFVSQGDTAVKRRLAERILSAGGRLADLHSLPTLQFDGVVIGVGTTVCKPVYVGPETRIGRNVQIMPMCSIGHDVTIGNHCTICPSVTISGYVTLMDGVFLGAGAIIVNGREDRRLIIGNDVTVAAGAVVMKSVADGGTVMGNPARPLRDLARLRRRRD